MSNPHTAPEYGGELRHFPPGANPYLDEFVRLGGRADAPRSFEESLRNLGRLRDVGVYRERWRLIRRYAHAIPSEEALAALVSWSPLVEIGAGSGYWARLLADRGADVVAYDKAPWGSDHPLCTGPHFFPIHRLEAHEAADRHPGRALFLCWPPYSDPMAADALGAYRRAGGRRLAYIGEAHEGCTADDRFFRRLRAWTLLGELWLPQWPGVHDSLLFYELR